MNRELALLAMQGIKGKKKNSLLLMGILFISLVFTTILVSLTDSLNKTSENYRYDTYGEWQVALYNGTQEDKVYLEQCTDITEIGTACSYGTLLSDTAIGTVDETLIENGRLTMQSGKFPEKAGEIAMEASLLSALGYDYDLNQTIRLDIQIDSETIVTKEYTLCGVLKYYSGLWKHTENPLVGAIITQKAAEDLTSTPIYQYFLCSSGNTEHFYKQVADCITENNINGGVLEKNIFAYPNTQDETNYDFYILLILITAVVAIGCVYAIQIHEQIRSIALFRSIGGTKVQLVKILFFETLYLLLPSIIFGVPFGLVVLYMMFHFFIQISHVTFYVSISFATLAVIILLWFVSIFLCRFFIMWSALHQPLTGRIGISVKSRRMQNRMVRFFTVFLAGIFSAVIFFTILEVLPEEYEKKQIEEQPSYSVACGTKSIGTEEKMAFQEIPGVEKIVAKGRLTGELIFSGMEHNALAQKCIENDIGSQPYLQEIALDNGETETIAFPDGIGIHVTVVSEEYLNDFVPPCPSSADYEKFLSGEEVLIVFYTETDGKIAIDEKTYTDTGLNTGDTVNLAFYSKWKAADGENMELSTPEKIGMYSAKIGSVMKLVWESDMEYIGNRNSYYNVLVSRNFIQKVLDESIQDRMLAPGLTTGEIYGDTHANLYTTTNASYLSTDSVVADVAQRNGMYLENYREKHTAELMAHIQQILTVVSIGVSILLTVLLIFWNIITISSKTNAKTYGILQAIGMSKREMRNRILGNGFALGILSLIFASGVYFLYQLQRARVEQGRIWRDYQERVGIYDLLLSKYKYLKLCGVSTELIISVSLNIVLFFMLLLYVGNRRLLKTEPAEKLYR